MRHQAPMTTSMPTNGIVAAGATCGIDLRKSPRRVWWNSPDDERNRQEKLLLSLPEREFSFIAVPLSLTKQNSLEGVHFAHNIRTFLRTLFQLNSYDAQWITYTNTHNSLLLLLFCFPVGWELLHTNPILLLQLQVPLPLLYGYMVIWFSKVGKILLPASRNYSTCEQKILSL